MLEDRQGASRRAFLQAGLTVGLGVTILPLGLDAARAGAPDPLAVDAAVARSLAHVIRAGVNDVFPRPLELRSFVFGEAALIQRNMDALAKAVGWAEACPYFCRYMAELLIEEHGRIPARHRVAFAERFAEMLEEGRPAAYQALFAVRLLGSPPYAREDVLAHYLRMLDAAASPIVIRAVLDALPAATDRTAWAPLFDNRESLDPATRRALYRLALPRLTEGERAALATTEARGPDWDPLMRQVFLEAMPPLG